MKKNQEISIKSLRQAGWKVRVIHSRHLFLPSDGKIVPAPTGGTTRIELTSPGGVNAHGVATCSERDNYCKKIGNKIALDRAIAFYHSLPASKTDGETPRMAQEAAGQDEPSSTKLNVISLDCAQKIIEDCDVIQDTYGYDCDITIDETTKLDEWGKFMLVSYDDGKGSYWDIEVDRQTNQFVFVDDNMIRFKDKDGDKLDLYFFKSMKIMKYLKKQEKKEGKSNE
jgi:hypothetical protein